MPTVDAAQQNGNPSAKEKFQNHVIERANALLKLGYPVIALQGKIPEGRGWQGANATIEHLASRIRAGCNIGVVFGQDLGDGTGLIALDVDIPIPAISAAIKAALPDSAMRVGNWPKFLMPFRMALADAVSRDLNYYTTGALGSVDHLTIQILGRSKNAGYGPKQAAVDGIHPSTGRPFTWTADEHGRVIFNSSPVGWPVIELGGVLEAFDGVMATFGYSRRQPASPGTGNDFEGDVTDEMVKDAQQLIEAALAELAGMGSGTGRGTKALELGRFIGVVIRSGRIDLEDVKARLQAAMPDNWNALREFERGVDFSDGRRQQWIANGRTVDWDAAAAEQGVSLDDEQGIELDEEPQPKPSMNFEDFMHDAPDAEAFKAEEKAQAKDLYRAALIEAVCNIMHDALRLREAEKRQADEDQAWGFMSSLLAAGMAGAGELATAWLKRAARLNAANSARFASDAQDVLDAIGKLQPTEASWAVYAAQLLALGVASNPGDAIRQAQAEHKNGEAPEATVSWGKKLLLEVPRDWDCDGADIRNERSSNLAYFLAVKLGVWPFFDEFKQQTAFQRLGAWPHVSDAQLEVWNQRMQRAVGGIYTLATDARKPWGGRHYTPAVANVDIWLRDFSEARRFNSIVEKMAAWPRTRHAGFGDWLARYTGHAPGDANYRRVCLIGQHFMRGFVGRAAAPGCMYDALMVLIGFQGPGKTSMGRSLTDPIAADAYAPDFNVKFDRSTGHNRAAQALTGILLGELAELSEMRHHDNEELKAFLSMRVDRGRDINGADTYGVKRQAAFIGTFNPTVPGMTGGEILVEVAKLPVFMRRDRIRELMAAADKGFLKDLSGNRRIMPVEVLVEEIDRVALAAEAPLLISEALAQLDEAGLRKKGSDLEVSMPHELRLLLGGSEGGYMSAGDMTDRLNDELAPFMAEEPNLIVTLRDLRDHMQLNRSRKDRDDLSMALSRLGFVRQEARGAHGATWHVKGSREAARHVIADRMLGRVCGLVWGGYFDAKGRKAQNPEQEADTFRPSD